MQATSQHFWQPVGDGEKKNILVGVMGEMSSHSSCWQDACTSSCSGAGNQSEDEAKKAKEVHLRRCALGLAQVSPMQDNRGCTFVLDLAKSKHIWAAIYKSYMSKYECDSLRISVQKQVSREQSFWNL